MRIWLDDDCERDPWVPGWTVVRTADEAIALLASNEVEMISLDHDLGDFRYEPYPYEVTGMEVVKWMIENKVFPKAINVHSNNSVRAIVMASDLNKFAPAGVRVVMWRFDGSSQLFRDLDELLVSKE